MTESIAPQHDDPEGTPRQRSRWLAGIGGLALVYFLVKLMLFGVGLANKQHQAMEEERRRREMIERELPKILKEQGYDSIQEWALDQRRAGSLHRDDRADDSPANRPGEDDAANFESESSDKPSPITDTRDDTQQTVQP